MATPKGIDKPGMATGNKNGTQSSTINAGNPRKCKCSTTVRKVIGRPGAISSRLSSSSLRRLACGG